MIKPEAFLALEASLSERIGQALAEALGDLYLRVSDALDAGDVASARQILGTLSLSSLVEDHRDYIAYLTHMAMLFGASRVTQQPGTSVVGMGFEKMTAHQMQTAFEQRITLEGEAFLKTLGDDWLKAYEANLPLPVGVEKAERILTGFGSFMDAAGKAFMNKSSSLHTSRVSAYGFTAEADVLGLDEYQISEQLDNRTCPVCRLMHGKKFKVKDARALLEVTVRTQNAEELKSHQPWPKQSKEALGLMSKMTSRELVDAGWHVPPFHPHCRGLLVRVGHAPPQAQIDQGFVPDPYKASMEDFHALRVDLSEEELKRWNNEVKMAPAELLARLSGTPVDEYLSGLLLSAKPRAYSGLKSILFGDNIRVRVNRQMFGSAENAAMTIDIGADGMKLDLLDLSSVDQGKGIGKKFMRELYTATKDMGLPSIKLLAGLDVGGYAWAKYGFKPLAIDWTELRGYLTKMFETKGLAKTLPVVQSKLFKAVMASDDSAMIYALADSPMGYDLLAGRWWEGALSLSDPEAVTRFLTYIGELK
jgi:GNAT superfamily N-acetyltransferase